MALFTSRLGSPWKRSSEEPLALKFDAVYREAIVNLAWRANPHGSTELPYRKRRIFTLDLLASGPLADFDRTARELFTILGGGGHERLHILNDERIEHNEEKVIDRILVNDEDHHVTLASSGNSYSVLSTKVAVQLFRNGEARARDYARLKRAQKNKRLVQVLYSPQGGRERGHFKKAYQGHISRLSDESLTLQTSEGYRTLRFNRIRKLDLLPRFAKLAEEPVLRLNMFIDQYDLDSFAVVINYGYRDDPRLSRVGHLKPEARKALTVNEIANAVIEHTRMNGGDL